MPKRPGRTRPTTLRPLSGFGRLLVYWAAPDLGMPVGAGPINGPTPMRDYFRGTSLPLMRGGHSVVLDDEKRTLMDESADFRSAGAVLEH